MEENIGLAQKNKSFIDKLLIGMEDTNELPGKLLDIMVEEGTTDLYSEYKKLKSLIDKEYKNKDLLRLLAVQSLVMPSMTSNIRVLRDLMSVTEDNNMDTAINLLLYNILECVRDYEQSERSYDTIEDFLSLRDLLENIEDVHFKARELKYGNLRLIPDGYHFDWNRKLYRHLVSVDNRILGRTYDNPQIKYGKLYITIETTTGLIDYFITIRKPNERVRVEKLTPQKVNYLQDELYSRSYFSFELKHIAREN